MIGVGRARSHPSFEAEPRSRHFGGLLDEDRFAVRAFSETRACGKAVEPHQELEADWLKGDVDLLGEGDVAVPHNNVCRRSVMKHRDPSP